MSIRCFGGNVITKVDCSQYGNVSLATGEYEYVLQKANEGDIVHVVDMTSFTITVIKGDGYVAVDTDGAERRIGEGDVLHGEAVDATLRMPCGEAIVLIASSREKAGGDKSVAETRASDVYRVEKPWGYELWLNGRHPSYAFKKIHIESGTKTSLQYHHFKKETNLLVRGSALLHYKENDHVPNNKVTSQDVSSVEINAICAVDVTPMVVHRLEAITDIDLYEVSTPHLDDVVRILDDTQRGSGRIDSEHPTCRIDV